MKPLFKQAPSNFTDLHASELDQKKLIHKNNTDADYKSFTLIEYTDADWLRNMLWFYIIGLIWTCEFIFGMTLIYQLLFSKYFD